MKRSWYLAIGLLLFSVFITYEVDAKEQSLTLQEQWQFYNEQFITSTGDTNATGIPVDLPIELEQLTGKVSGYGTFIKTILLPEHLQEKTLAIQLPFTYSAAKVYINGQLYEEVGKVATNEEEHERNLKTVIIPISTPLSEVEIAIQLSSFHHIRGGFSAAPIIGEWEFLHQAFIWERYIAIFVIGIIFIAGLLTFTIGVLHRKEHLFLVFGLFALVVAVRGIVAEPFLYHDLPIGISYETATRLEYFTTNTCFALYALFIYILYNKLSSKWINFPCIIILITLAVLSLVTDMPIFQTLFFSVFPIMLIFVFYNIWVMCKAFYLKLNLAKPLMLGVIFVFIGLVLDFLTGMGIIYLPPMANFMIAVNVIIVLYSIGANYVQQMHTVTTLNNELDEKVKRRTEQLDRANQELQKLVQLDGLTKVYNRHKFNEALAHYFEESSVHHTPLSLIMIDIDDFKKYNDEYGHVKGDELLMILASFINEQLPPDTLFARYGGEEFALILPFYKPNEAYAIGESIREAVVEKALPHRSSELGIITISLGSAERIQDHVQTINEFIHCADMRLYKSKENGRNQMTIT